ncbi:MAG: TetR/AcrR family transcriptional regulator [Tenericutes bacterium HGW-Tenericutes-1]|jgi:AcrR family transcriptional regulator|nr:MAG: TetR/AcrR family transcriptional regulator [Tenericutes bacterium HGW-Tenericutes-1]
MTTKEKIIHEALSLFSVRGFSSVSVRDIAYAAGIKESSLYNHFVNKQDIFNQTIAFCQERVTSQYELLYLQNSISSRVEIHSQLVHDILYSISQSIFRINLSDDYNRMFRQMLTIEQYNSGELRDLYKDIFIDQAIQYQIILFTYLMENGVIIKGQPKALALEFYSPIFLLLSRYDSLDDEASRLLKIHIDYFILKNTSK